MNERANLAASVAGRLLHRAKRTGDDYQTLLLSYCLERFLYRLGLSSCRDRFVLKGAMLLRLWSENPYRATRDLDLLRLGDGAFDAIRKDLREIIEAPAPEDAVTFECDQLRLEAIRAEEEYVGTRALMPARCGKARLTLQIDMGLGDAV
ncbi:MAG: nucleotidyl transferase AbiEii/AbiGii toxin family protein [Planctomycetes bacterium]|nr:nucleotidyl transferase AbiEii/AbiGii toxin family protein [Planctomycetota bacterium]